MNKKIILYFFMLVLIVNKSIAQEITQTVKGIVIDRASEKSLQGATVSVVDLGITTITDAEGRFTLNKVPIGRQKILISFAGYKAAVFPEILITAGKEVMVDVALEQSSEVLQEITIKSAKVKKAVATNEFVVGSNRSFNVEEVTRFAGGRNDPSKLVSNFAGVVANNDSRNDIVVRGNSPSGVLWRIEGLPSPNPNHYATLGTTGGPVSALNTNALKTSDFLSGAFPAEFGNANAAVFDINLRNGNSSKHERTLQVNLFSGLEVMLEGPLSKKKNGSSYLIGYRYSFAQIGASLGLNIGTTATPKYQDWVYNLNFAKGKAGKLSLYGMGGINSIDFIGKDVDTTDFYARKDQDSYNSGNFSIFGAKHTIDIGKKSYLRSGISFASEKSNYDLYQYPLPFVDYTNRYQVTKSRNQQNTFRFTSFLNTKVNAKLSWRAGILGENFMLDTKVEDREGKQANDPFNTIRNFNDNFFLLQYFAQIKYKLTDKLTLNAGLHGSKFNFNGSNTFEPRASMLYQVSRTDQLYLSFGLHSQIQAMPVYLFENKLQNGEVDKSNRNLDFTKSAHYVVGYEKRFGTDWRLKLEGYYQGLTNVPVDQISSGFSILNAGADFSFPDRGGLVNQGTGSNTGVEITFERFLSKGYYLLLTSSFFNAKYKGSDGIERNTTFNFGHVVNMLAGKEWKVGRKKKDAFTLDMKVTSIGGRYTTPIDLEASILANKEVLDETMFNSVKLESFFRADVKIGFRVNSSRRKISQTFFLDFQNVTNKENIFLQRYNPLTQTIGAVNQIGFFPDLLYRITF